MLISFKFRNLYSFRDETEFSTLAAGDIKTHESSLLPVPGNNADMRLLSLSAIYGGNASGKSNFFAAIAALKHCVLTQKVDGIVPFLLDGKNEGEAFLEICFANKGRIFSYALCISLENIIENPPPKAFVKSEELIDVTGGEGLLIFKREPNISFSKDGLPGVSEDEANRWRDMDAEKILLAYLEEQFKHELSPCVEWFRDVLQIIPAGAKTTSFAMLLIKDGDRFAHELNMADTSISKLGFRDVVNATSHLPQKTLEDLKSINCDFMGEYGDDSILYYKDKNGNIAAKECVSIHAVGDDGRIIFPINMESDGSRKYMQVLPIILDDQPHVYVVDEIDRSLHPYLMALLTRRFRSTVENGAAKQLIFTTHDVLLMQDNELRNDEIWLVNREMDGTSKMVSYYDYAETGNASNPMKDYLQGRVGGLPAINW